MPPVNEKAGSFDQVSAHHHKAAAVRTAIDPSQTVLHPTGRGNKMARYAKGWRMNSPHDEELNVRAELEDWLPPHEFARKVETIDRFKSDERLTQRSSSQTIGSGYSGSSATDRRGLLRC
jgi:hypothetical protein